MDIARCEKVQNNGKKLGSKPNQAREEVDGFAMQRRIFVQPADFVNGNVIKPIFGLEIFVLRRRFKALEIIIEPLTGLVHYSKTTGNQKRLNWQH